MVECSVVQYEDEVNSITVYFKGNKDKSLYIDTNNELAAFGVDCGAIKAPDGWDRQCETLDYDWWNIEWEKITSCPDEYKDKME